MKTSMLAAAMSYIDDDLVSAAVDYKPKRNRLPAPYRITASIAAACMVLAIGVTTVHIQLKQYVKEMILNLSQVQSLWTATLTGVTAAGQLRSRRT